MNDKIEKLIDDAKLTAVLEMFDDELKKFAKLIVQECISVVEGGSFLHNQAPTAIFARECSGAIKRHFGINPNEITTAMLDTAINQCEQELAKNPELKNDKNCNHTQTV